MVSLCTFCSKGIEEQELIMKMRNSRKKSKQKLIPYHKLCVKRLSSANGATRKNVRNPLRGYR